MATVTPATPCIQIITIPPGGSMSIPAGATIVSSDATDNSVLTSTCPDIENQLQNLGPRICYSFRWESVALVGPLNDAYFQQFIVGSTVYDLKGPYTIGLISQDYAPYNGTPAQVGAAVTKGVPTPVGKVENTCDLGSGTKRIIVSVPQALGVPQLKVLNPDSQGGGSTLYLKGTVLSGCTCASDPTL